MWLLNTVSSDERGVHSHQVDIYDIVHKQEELSLRSWRSRHQLMHLLERWHIGRFVHEVALYVSDFMLVGVEQAEQHRGIVVCEVEGREHSQRAIGNVLVVSFVAELAPVAIGERHVLRTLVGDIKSWNVLKSYNTRRRECDVTRMVQTTCTCYQRPTYVCKHWTWESRT